MCRLGPDNTRTDRDAGGSPTAGATPGADSSATPPQNAAATPSTVPDAATAVAADAATPSVPALSSGAVTEVLSAAAQEQRRPQPASRDYFSRYVRFAEMWRANAFFADQSDCVGLLLQHAHVHYERPGQFGKTTLLEMLGAFVDRFTTNADFQVLFGGTKAAAIYHPLRQQCHIVRISLSIDARRPLHEIPELLSAAVNDGVRSFQVAYPDVHVNVEENGIRTLSSLGIAIAKISAREVRAGNTKRTCLYVLTDEYDRIINTFIAQREP